MAAHRKLNKIYKRRTDNLESTVDPATYQNNKLDADSKAYEKRTWFMNVKLPSQSASINMTVPMAECFHSCQCVINNYVGQ